MKIKDSTRTRLTGYVGIIVTTLLTPGGKLISSAMAAAVVVGLVSLNTPDKNTKIADATPTIIPADNPNLDPGLLGVRDLPLTVQHDMLAPETLGSDQHESPALAPQTPQAGFATQGISSDNLASTYIAGASSGGLPTLPATGPRFVPKFVPGSPPDITTKCTPISEIEDALRKGLVAPDVVICKEDVVTADSSPPALGDAPSTNDPVLLSAPVEVAKENAPYASPYSPKIAGLAPDLFTQAIQPSLAIAAISEPSTLAMLFLGLIGIASLYRRKNFLVRNTSRQLTPC